MSLTLPAATTGQTFSLTDDKSAQASARLRMAADGFEALFLNEILKSGRAASFGDSLFGGSGVETTQSLLDQKLTETGAGKSGLGLSNAIYKQFSSHLPGTTE